MNQAGLGCVRVPHKSSAKLFINIKQLKAVFTDQNYIRAFQRHRTIDPKTIRVWVDAILSRAGTNNASVIDACCGWGRFTLPIARELFQSGGKVHAVDQSNEMIIECRHRALGERLTNIAFSECDIWDFHPETLVDSIFFSEAIHALDNIEGLFIRYGRKNSSPNNHQSSPSEKSPVRTPHHSGALRDFSGF